MLESEDVVYGRIPLLTKRLIYKHPIIGAAITIPDPVDG